MVGSVMIMIIPGAGRTARCMAKVRRGVLILLKPIGLFQGHQFSQKEIIFPKAESSKVKSDFMKYIKYQLYNLNGLTMN